MDPRFCCVLYDLCLGEYRNKSFGHGTNGADFGLDLKAPRQVHGSLNSTRPSLITRAFAELV